MTERTPNRADRTDEPDEPDGPDGPSGPDEDGYALLAEAAERMRVDDPGAGEFGSSLARAVAATRRSGYVLAQAPGGTVRIARHVVVAAVREAVDAVADVATARIDLDVAGRDDLTGVTADVLARYGADLGAAADDVHLVAGTVLADLLGRPVALHVRVVDVTVGDPATTDPDLDPPPSTR